MTEPTIIYPDCKTGSKDLDHQIKEARRAAMAALTLEEKLAGQKQIKALEAQRNQKRRPLFVRDVQWMTAENAEIGWV